MSPVTEVTSQSWFGRIGGAIKGVFIGIILILLSFVVLFWNEGRSVKTYKALKQGSKDVISVSSDAVDSANDGKLIHFSGMVKTTGTLQDAAFGVTSEGVRLMREVEMYQWDEETSSDTKKKLGGGTETVTTYTPVKKWSSTLIDSDSFHGENKSKRNPSSMPYSSKTINTEEAKVGAFELSNSLIGKINKSQSLTIPEDAKLPDELADKAKRHEGGYYVGNPSSPEIGDLRIKFKEVPETEVSIIAKQSGNTLAPYQTKAGRDLELLHEGVHDAVAMFDAEHSANKALTWGLRFGGWLLMVIGFAMMLKPLSVVADVVPFIGSIIGAGTTLISMLVSAVLSIMTIAVAWIFYRPVLGIILIAISVGIAVFVGMKLGKAKAKQKAATATA